MDGQGGPEPLPAPESSNDRLGLARLGLGALVAVLAFVLALVLLTRDAGIDVALKGTIRSNVRFRPR